MADSVGSILHEADPTENPRMDQRKQSSHNGTKEPWVRGGGAEMRVGTRNSHSGQEADGTASENMGKGTQGRQSGEDGGGSRRQNYGLEGEHERLLWDELRESLAGVAVGRKRGLPYSQDGVRAFEKPRRDRASEEQRRRLIDEAISVLLEASSDEEGLEHGSL